MKLITTKKIILRALKTPTQPTDMQASNCFADMHAKANTNYRLKKKHKNFAASFLRLRVSICVSLHIAATNSRFISKHSSRVYSDGMADILKLCKIMSHMRIAHRNNVCGLKEITSVILYVHGKVIDNFIYDFPITFRFLEFTESIYLPVCKNISHLEAFFWNIRRIHGRQHFIENFSKCGNIALEKGLIQPTIFDKHQVSEALKTYFLNRNELRKIMEATKNGSSMVVEFVDGLSIDARRNCFIHCCSLSIGAIAATTILLPHLPLLLQ